MKRNFNMYILLQIKEGKKWWGASGQARVWMELLPTASGHREALPPQKSLLKNKKILLVEIRLFNGNIVIDDILLADIRAMNALSSFLSFFFFEETFDSPIRKYLKGTWQRGGFSGVFA
jgi:hypothetical protein